MRNRIDILVWIIIILLILLPYLSEYAYVLEYVDISPWDYQKLTDVDARIELIDEPQDGGKVLVTERITFDVHQANENDLCYELWRDLPEQEVDGLKLDYTVLSVKQILDDGTEIPYEKNYRMLSSNQDYKNGSRTWYHSKGPYSRLAEQYECVFFYVDGIYRDQVTFEITYEMNNVALRYKDCSDLYLSLYSESPIKDLNSYKAEILIPNKDMPSKGNYEYYTYGTNNESFSVYESADLNPGYHTFCIDLDENDLQFKPYNLYIEFELVAFGTDKHIFTEYAGLNDYSYDYALDEIRAEQKIEAHKPASFRVLKIIIFIFLLAVSFAILASTLNTPHHMKKKHIFYIPTDSPEYYTGIPDDLDPGFIANLVFSKRTKKKYYSGIYSALLLSLARKNYVRIEQYGSKDILITINDLSAMQENSIMPFDPLTESETLYYNLLKHHTVGKMILMSEFQKGISEDYENTASFDENIKKAFTNIGVNKEFYQKADFTQPKDKMLSTGKVYFYVGLVFIFLVNIISFHTRLDLAFGAYFILGLTCLFSALYLKCNAEKYVLLTQKGEDEYAKWKGLYNYLKSDNVISDTNVGNMPIWERYFIYATAFGIPSKITKTLGFDSSSHTNTSADTYDSILSNTYINTGYFHRSGHRIRRAVNRGARFHRRTTGYGYTGGGRSWSSYGGGGS